MISLLVFGACFALRGPDAPDWMMPTAYGALAVFALALAFVVGAMRRPALTIRVALAISLLPRISPRIAKKVEEKLFELIRGFDVLKDQQNLGTFLIWTVVYWGANGFAVWVLARGFGLPLSPIGAFATMGIVGVGITLPNSPALIGQFVWFMLLGLSLYIPGADDPHAPAYSQAYLFATVHYILQVVWYIALGAIGLATPWVSFRDLRAARKTGE